MPDANGKLFGLLPRYRYSIRGLLIFMFGLAVGFAYGRAGGSNWPDRLLAVFFGWFLIGMAEVSWEAAIRWQMRSPGISREVRFGMVLDILWPLGVIGMVLLALGLDEWRRSSTSESGDSELMDSWTLPALVQAALMLAVICGYSDSRQSARAIAAKKSIWTPLVAVFLAGFAFLWLSLVVANQMLVASLVHIAIEGVYSFQPNRWLGQDFMPVRLFPELEREFIHGGLAAGIGSALAFALAYFAVAPRRLHWSVRAAAFLGWAGCITIVLTLTSWAATTALPVLSPYIADKILTHRAASYVFGLALILFASSVWAWRINAYAAPDAGLTGADDDLISRPLHRQKAVMICFLVAALWGSVSLWTGLDFLQSMFRNVFGGSSFWTLGNLFRRIGTIVEVHLSEPRWIIRLAAMVVVAQQLWRTWRIEKAERLPVCALSPISYFLGASLMTITAIVGTPALAWYGVAFYFWTAGR